MKGKCDKHNRTFLGEECPVCTLEAGKKVPDEIVHATNFNESGSKYLREIRCFIGNNKVDVYAVLDAFNVTDPGTQHAVKKLLCTGIRGKGDKLQDLKEAKDAIERQIQMEESKQC